jgi:transposase
MRSSIRRPAFMAVLSGLKGVWCYHSCVPQNRFVLFEYNDSRSGQVVNNTLENYQGILQTDGYSGYNGMRVKEGVTNLGCFAHCRRKFVEVTKVAAKTGTAHEIVGLIGKLYGIEEKVRAEKLCFIVRKELRQKEAKPILEKIHACLIRTKPPPQSALSNAVNYALNQWSYLIRYIDYGEAEIDNNWAENQIRPFALGRRNWLFAGNKSAAETAAFFYGLIQTCKLNNINSRKYLNYVLSKAAQMRRGEIAPQSLLPQFFDKNLLS